MPAGAGTWFVDIEAGGGRRSTVSEMMLVLVRDLRAALELVPGTSEMLDRREMPLAVRVALR